MTKIFIYGKENNAKNYINALKSLKVDYVATEDVKKSYDCTHLLLIGGGDVLPFFYNKPLLSCNDTNLKRDYNELYLINYFYKNKRPILGVCRGMQIINVFFGGTLNQKIESNVTHYKAGTDIYHQIKLESGFIKDIYRQCCTKIVNSSHRQSIEKIAPCLHIRAKSIDNCIEAIESNNNKIIGVQFHPERMKNGLSIYEYFVNL